MAGAAVMVAKIATGEIAENTEPKRESAAAELGRKGGQARAAKLSGKKRAEIAEKSARAGRAGSEKYSRIECRIVLLLGRASLHPTRTFMCKRAVAARWPVERSREVQRECDDGGPNTKIRSPDQKQHRSAREALRPFSPDGQSLAIKMTNHHAPLVDQASEKHAASRCDN